MASGLDKYSLIQGLKASRWAVQCGESERLQGKKRGKCELRLRQAGAKRAEARGRNRGWRAWMEEVFSGRKKRFRCLRRSATFAATKRPGSFRNHLGASPALLRPVR